MKAILFIHGLSAKVEDNQFFLEEMKKYRNVKVYSFILPGHENNQVTKVKYDEWIKSSEEELKKVLKKHKKVIIVAHSMGCIIATNLASKYKQISKLVLIAPAFLYGNLKQNIIDIENIITRKVDNDVGHGFEGVFKKILEVPKEVFFEYRKLARKNMNNIGKITCPTLIMHGLIDNVIPLDSSKMVYDRLKCDKDLVWIESTRHQVFKSKKKKEITEYIYRYISFPFLYRITKRKVI